MIKDERYYAILVLLEKFQKKLPPNLTREITPEHNEAYIEELYDIEFDTIRLALRQLAASECVYYPGVATIRNKCIELSLPDIPDHGEAWGIIQNVIKEHGYIKILEQGISFGHPVIDEAVNYIGLNELCYSTDSNLFPRFRDVYNMLAKRKVDEARMLPEVKEHRALLVGEQIKQLSDKLGE